MTENVTEELTGEITGELTETETEYSTEELTETEIEDDKYNDSVRILFESNDMKDLCGVFGKILKFCVVDNFSCGVGENEDRTDLRAWWSVHLSYQHKDGGMNGMELFRAHYENGKWTFNEK